MIDLSAKKMYGEKELCIKHLFGSLDSVKDRLVEYTLTCEQESTYAAKLAIDKLAEEVVYLDLLVKKLVKFESV